MPSDCSFAELKSAIVDKKRSVYVTFLMCTDEDDVVETYNRYMDPVPNVDITDDYRSEKAEVERRGKRLGYFAWLAKAVLGGKMVKYDTLDEGGLAGMPGTIGGAGCCTIL